MISNEKLYGSVGALWREYINAWDVVLTGNINKKVVSELVQKMKVIAEKALAQEQELAAHPLPELPAILPVDRNLLTLESKAGEELFRKRTEGDCTVKVVSSKGELITMQDAHMAQLAPFSDKFIFTKESPEAKKLTLTLTFDGNEMAFVDLLYFMYTGVINKSLYSLESIRSFGRDYGIDSLNIPLAVNADPLRDLVFTLQRLAKASTLQELKERWQKLLGKGLPISNGCALYAIGRVLVRWKAEHSQIENIEEITPFIEHVKEVYATIYNRKVSFETLGLATQPALFDITDTVSVNPFLKTALVAWALLNKSPPTLYLAEPSRALYCKEPDATILEDEQGFYGITMGQITDAANKEKIFYAYTPRHNSKPLLLNSKYPLPPGSITFLPTWPLRVEVSNLNPRNAEGALTTYPESSFAGIEECSYNQKIADVRASYQKIARIAKTTATEGIQIFQTNGRVNADKVRSLKKHDSSLEAFECVAEVFTKYGYTGKKMGSYPPGTLYYKVHLPKNCLAQQSLAEEKKCLFTFADGSELVLPHIAIKDKMIQANAGFNSEQVEAFTLAGSANDFENRALIAYLKNERPIDEKVSVNQVDALIALAERHDMQGLLNTTKKMYLHPNQLTNKEPLNIESFKRLRRYQHDILITLLKCEGNQKAADFIDRIVTILPTQPTIWNESDKKLLEQLGQSLVQVSGEVLVEVINWTKENGYTSLYEQLCTKLNVASNPFC